MCFLQVNIFSHFFAYEIRQTSILVELLRFDIIRKAEIEPHIGCSSVFFLFWPTFNPRLFTDNQVVLTTFEQCRTHIDIGLLE